MFIKSWKIHPKASKIEKAEKTCMGFANKGGTQWCGPYTNANKAGFWLYSPINMELYFDGEKFHVNYEEEYGSEDYEIVKKLIRNSDESTIEKWCFPNVGRTKTTIGFVEKNTIQIWTGRIFKTPPNWCLRICNPVNFPKKNFEITEAIIETDWMYYDIWINISCSKGEIKINKNSPLAQIIPTKRESFEEKWSLEENTINRENKESEEIFKFWVEYNKKKFEMGGNQMLNQNLRKDSTTYFKEKKKNIESNKHQGCPFAKKIIEKDVIEFKKLKSKAEYFSVFDRDKTKELKIIAEASKKQ